MSVQRRLVNLGTTLGFSVGAVGFALAAGALAALYI